LAEAVATRRGSLNAQVAQEILGLEDLLDLRDSMNAVVFEPERGWIHYAMGQVPATSAPFVSLDFGAWAQGPRP
jgi:hypothetical protein